jgi:DNA-binding MarR family transcriptional regulator
MPANIQDNPANGFRLETFLPYRLAVATDQMSHVFAEQLNETFNLTLPEWRILAVVAEHGTLSPTTVGMRTVMDKVKVSRAAQTLVAKGMIRQNQDPRDGRGRLLRLTRKGTTTHAAIVLLVKRLEATVFDLSRAEIAALTRVLAKITTRIETIEHATPAMAGD